MLIVLLPASALPGVPLAAPEAFTLSQSGLSMSENEIASPSASLAEMVADNATFSSPKIVGVSIIGAELDCVEGGGTCATPGGSMGVSSPPPPLHGAKPNKSPIRPVLYNTCANHLHHSGFGQC